MPNQLLHISISGIPTSDTVGTSGAALERCLLVTIRTFNLPARMWGIVAVSEVMTRAPLVTLEPTADVEAAASLMTEKGIHRVLVTDGDRLVGIVSALDVAKAVADGKLTRRTDVFNRDEGFQNGE